MHRMWKVHLVDTNARKDVVVTAATQDEAKRTAEAEHPGYGAAAAKDLGETFYCAS